MQTNYLRVNTVYGAKGVWHLIPRKHLLRKFILTTKSSETDTVITQMLQSKVIVIN